MLPSEPAGRVRQRRTDALGLMREIRLRSSYAVINPASLQLCRDKSGFALLRQGFRLRQGYAGQVGGLRRDIAGERIRTADVQLGNGLKGRLAIAATKGYGGGAPRVTNSVQACRGNRIPPAWPPGRTTAHVQHVAHRAERYWRRSGSGAATAHELSIVSPELLVSPELPNSAELDDLVEREILAISQVVQILGFGVRFPGAGAHEVGLKPNGID